MFRRNFIYVLGALFLTAGGLLAQPPVEARIAGLENNEEYMSLLREDARERETLCFGHSSGRIPVEVALREDAGAWTVEKVNIFRTARVLMDGIAYVRNSDIANKQLCR